MLENVIIFLFVVTLIRVLAPGSLQKKKKRYHYIDISYQGSRFSGFFFAQFDLRNHLPREEYNFFSAQGLGPKGRKKVDFFPREMVSEVELCKKITKTGSRVCESNFLYMLCKSLEFFFFFFFSR